jgi:hypothetical protein
MVHGLSCPLLHFFRIVYEPKAQTSWQVHPVEFGVTRKKMAYVTEVTELVNMAYAIPGRGCLRKLGIVAPCFLVQGIALRRGIGTLLGNQKATVEGYEVGMLRVSVARMQRRAPIVDIQRSKRDRTGLALNTIRQQPGVIAFSGRWIGYIGQI